MAHELVTEYKNPIQTQFRAWDKKRKIFVYDFYLDSSGFAYRVDYDLHEYKNLIVTRYTGLKDKNGVDIFEGDIAKGLAPWGPTDIFYELQYAQFGGRDTDDFHPLNRYESENYYEVIGNIYENGELLNARE